MTFGESTEAELNLSILSGRPGTTGVPPAERVSHRLWAEHLGLMSTDGQPNPDDDRLATSGPTI